MRLVDADALLEELAGDYNNLEGMPHDLEAAVYAIMDAPTIAYSELVVNKETAQAIENAIVNCLNRHVYRLIWQSNNREG